MIGGRDHALTDLSAATVDLLAPIVAIDRGSFR
jgi:hypothetical protein